jgi:hypothetical protein
MNLNSAITITFETKMKRLISPNRLLRTLASACLVLCCLLVAGVAPAQTSANPPDRISYQSFVADANGNPLGNTNTGPQNFDVVFRIFNDPTAGNEIWAEQQTVTVDRGNFSVLLGEGANVGSEPRPLPLSSIFYAPDASSRYVELTIRGIGAGTPPADVTIRPRLRLLATPYSFLAQNALNASSLVNSSNQPIITVSTTNMSVVGSLSGSSLSVSGAVNASALNVSGPIAAASFSGNPSFSGSPTVGNLTMNGAVSGNPSFSGTPVFGNVTFTKPIPGATLSSATLNNPTVNGPATLNTVTLNNPTLNGGVAGNPTFTGYIGIGGGGDFPLHVYYTRPVSFNRSVGDLGNYSGGVYQHTTFANSQYSIVADGIVTAPNFEAFSDRRIKEVVANSDTRKDLETVRKLALTDYHYVDKQAMGTNLHKGFIAQEVMEIIPEAVGTGPNYIPNILTVAQAVRFDAGARSLAITLPKDHQLQVGDRVRLMTDDKQVELDVQSIPSAREFVVGQCEHQPTQVFVYGKRVRDFHTVDYTRIFSTGIGAIQELARRVDAMEASQGRLAELEKSAARVETLEREVSELKKTILVMSETMKGTRPAEQARSTPSQESAKEAQTLASVSLRR